MRLDHNISELLYQYDCVIVPELGGFVTNYSPAQLNENTSVFSPPYKSISFNSYLKNNDGLLAKHIAEKESMSFEKANKRIKKKVEQYFTKLNNGERVIFDKVGILYMDKSNKIQFSPDQSTNYLLDSFGLKQVYAYAVEPQNVVKKEETPILRVVPEPIRLIDTPESIPSESKIVPIRVKEASIEKEEKSKDKVVVLPKHEKADKGMKRRIWWAAAVILPIAIAGFFITSQSSVGNNHWAGLNPFKPTVTQKYQAREGDRVIPTVDLSTDFPDLFDIEKDKKYVMFSLTDEGDAIPIYTQNKKPAPKKKLIRTTTSIIESTYVAPLSIQTLRYHVVAGCFGELRNAEKKAKTIRAKGYEAFILDQRKGLYRVVYGSSSKRSDAMILLQRVKQNEDRKAWLLRK